MLASVCRISNLMIFLTLLIVKTSGNSEGHMVHGNLDEKNAIHHTLCMKPHIAQNKNSIEDKGILYDEDMEPSDVEPSESEEQAADTTRCSLSLREPS